MTSDAHLDDLPHAGESLVRAHASEIRALAQRRGISEVRVSTDGDLVGHVPDSLDAMDVAAFEVEIGELLGADLFLISDRVLTKPGVRQQVIDATPL